VTRNTHLKEVQSREGTRSSGSRPLGCVALERRETSPALTKTIQFDEEHCR